MSDQDNWKLTLESLLDDLRRSTAYLGLESEDMVNAAQEALDKIRRRSPQ